MSLGRFANAEQAMLTKSGNLTGLVNVKQSQLNLGVIEGLAGEVFNTDNCTVIENQNGLAFRFANGFQICTGRVELTNIIAGWLIEGWWTFPAPFANGEEPRVIHSVTQGTGFDAPSVDIRYRMSPTLTPASRAGVSLRCAQTSPTGAFVSGNIIKVEAVSIARWD